MARKLISKPVVTPLWNERPGDPVGFRSECYEELIRLRSDTGAASIVRAYRQAGPVQNLHLNDVGINADIGILQTWNTPSRSWLYVFPSFILALPESDCAVTVRSGLCRIGGETMPGFADALDNADIAEVVNYPRVKPGNQKEDMSGEMVAATR